MVRHRWDLIGKLPAFKRYVIADLHFHLSAVRAGRRTLSYAYDSNGTLILAVGPRHERTAMGCRPEDTVRPEVLDHEPDTLKIIYCRNCIDHQTSR